MTRFSLRFQRWILDGIADLLLKRLVLLGGCKRICCCSHDISSHLPCIWVAEEKEPQTDSYEDLQHDITSCSAMIRRIVESANPVCSLMER